LLWNWLAGYPAKLNTLPYQFGKFPKMSSWNRYLYCFDVQGVIKTKPEIASLKPNKWN
jgi:hypothetical protein